MKRSDRQHWGPSDAQFTISQCGYCKHNESATDCKVYELKPDKYLSNAEQCPSREEET